MTRRRPAHALDPRAALAASLVVPALLLGACGTGAQPPEPSPGVTRTAPQPSTAPTRATEETSTPAPTPTATSPSAPTEPPPDVLEGRALVWHDEFDGPTGSAVSPDWTVENSGGWYNNELQIYTPRPENVSLTGFGALHITARNEEFTGPDGISGEYTSARLQSVPAFLYGRIEARIRVPAGWGLWPAFWALGVETDSLGWPASGEIDVMEALNKADVLHIGAHGADADGELWSRRGELAVEGSLASDWHTYTVEWTSDSLEFSMDGQVFHEFARSDLLPGQVWPFDRPHQLLLNVAVGGDWPGPPVDGSAFPATMLVDWVRVYDSEVSR